MAHAARIRQGADAEAHDGRDDSIGPGATNLVTAAATAHVNRLPVLFLPRRFRIARARPGAQQLEDFHDGTVSANDTLRPVSRYFGPDRPPSNSWPRCRERSRCSPIRPSADRSPWRCRRTCRPWPGSTPRSCSSRAPCVSAQPPADDELAAAAEALRRAKRRSSSPEVARSMGSPATRSDGLWRRTAFQCGDAGRQGLPPLGPPPPAGRRRRDRLARGERSRPRCGPRARGGTASRTSRPAPIACSRRRG